MLTTLDNLLSDGEPSRASHKEIGTLRIDGDLEALRTRLRGMSDDELVKFGRQMHDVVYPLTYGPDGKPSVSAFSTQLEEP